MSDVVYGIATTLAVLALVWWVLSVRRHNAEIERRIAERDKERRP